MGGALRFGEVEVLVDIDLRLDRGEVTALVGPNGAGKTSLLRVLAGELALTAGTLGPSRAPVTALINDTPFLYDVLTPGEHVDFVARFRGRTVDVASVLDRVGLGHLPRTFARDLSLGERLRLALALVQVISPEVVLMDEPFNGLDPTTSAMLAIYLRKLAADGCAVVVATHHVADLAGIAKRVIALDSGRVVLDRPLMPGEQIHEARPGR